MQKYPILRSGFVSMTDAGLKQPKSSFDGHAAAILGKERLEPDDEHFYNENVQKLFVLTLKEANLNILDRFEVQENILKAAAQAFGTKNFWDWINFQSSSPIVSSVHQAFIIETLRYINGTPRKTHIQQWIRLLEAGSSQMKNAIRNEHYFEELRKLRESKAIPADMSAVFTKWLRQENGYYDFICSMAAIFGNRRTLALAS